MADPGRIELERAEDGERWRVRTPGKDVEGHMPLMKRFAVEDEDAEGHGFRFPRFSLEPDGEDENGEPLYRIEGEGDAEGHALMRRGFSAEEQDTEGHMPRVSKYFSLEPTGEQEDGNPVYRVKAEGDDAEGHRIKFR
jgi:hypothetical protein